jgi:hypothetical protein
MRKLSPSYFRQHIENHFDDLDMDLVVRKRKRCYAIYWRDDGEPLVRLRPTGRGDEVEVDHWEDDRWEPVEEFGLVLPLDEALQYISHDPAGLFFSDVPDEDDEEEFDSAKRAVAREGARNVYSLLLVCSMLGAAIGGLFSSLPWGLAASAAGGFLTSAIAILVVMRRRSVSISMILAGVAALLACVGGIIGSAVHGGLGSGVWPVLCGLSVGACCNWLLFCGRLLAWLVGLTAGLNLAVYLIDIWRIGDHYGGLVLVAFLAAVSASTCRVVMDFARHALQVLSDGPAKNQRVS